MRYCQRQKLFDQRKEEKTYVFKYHCYDLSLCLNIQKCLYFNSSQWNLFHTVEFLIWYHLKIISFSSIGPTDFAPLLESGH